MSVKALVDADSLLYKVGFTFEEKTDWGDGDPVSITSDLQSSKNAIDGIIENIKFKTGCDEVELWLTGSGNFRYSVTDTYKHNRTNSRKPTDYEHLKNYLIDNYKANVAVGYEADDVVVYLKTHYPDDYFLCAIDKDVLYQTVGTHYNYNSDELVVTTDYDVLRFFYYQILKGDPVDGYSGCKGIGDAKANKILDQAEENCKDNGGSLEDYYYGITVATYQAKFEVSEEEAEAMILTTGRLASMHQLKQRSDGGYDVVLWSYPKQP